MIEFNINTQLTTHHSTPTLQITVGTTPQAQRTYTLPTHHLSTHSVYIRNLCSSSTFSSITSLTLPTTTQTTFQDYIDYTRSCIYSPHKRAADYHPLRSHVSAWVLGEKLEDEEFKTAALRCLYDTIGANGCGSSGGGGVAQSPIQPADVEFVCAKTEEGSVLRAMLFDAVASHWRQAEVLSINYNVSVSSLFLMPSSFSFSDRGQGQHQGATVTWLSIYNTYADFHARLANSLKVGDGYRSALLKGVDEYVAGRLGLSEEAGEGVELAGEVEGERRKKRRGGLLTREGGYGWRRSGTQEGMRGREDGEVAVEDEGEEEGYVTAEDV